MVEEQLGNLVSDDPCVIESTLGNQGDTVFPDQTSVMHRYLYLVVNESKEFLKLVILNMGWKSAFDELTGCWSYVSMFCSHASSFAKPTTIDVSQLCACYWIYFICFVFVSFHV